MKAKIQDFKYYTMLSIINCINQLHFYLTRNILTRIYSSKFIFSLQRVIVCHQLIHFYRPIENDSKQFQVCTSLLPMRRNKPQINNLFAKQIYSLEQRRWCTIFLLSKDSYFRQHIQRISILHLEAGNSNNHTQEMWRYKMMKNHMMGNARKILLLFNKMK
jgi:hypothetical protein